MVTVATRQGRPCHGPSFTLIAAAVELLAVPEEREIELAADPGVMLEGQVERLASLAFRTAVDAGEPGAPRGTTAYSRVLSAIFRSPSRSFIFPWPSWTTSETTSPSRSTVDASRTSSRSVWNVYDRVWNEGRHPTPFGPPSSHGRLWSSIATIACRAACARFSASVAGAESRRPLAITFLVRVSVMVASGVIDSELRSSQTASPSQAKCIR